MNHDQPRTGADFARYALTLATAQGSPLRAAAAIAERDGEGGRLHRAFMQRAAVGALDTNDAALVDERAIAAAWLDGMAQFSAFDRILSDGAAMAGSLRAPVYCMTLNPAAATVEEGAPKPATQMTVAADILLERKVASIIVMAQELARARTAQTYLSRQMRLGIGAAVDREFFALIQSTSTPTAICSGSSAAQVLADVGAVLALCGVHAGSMLYLVVTTAIASRLAVKSVGGLPAFDMTPKGGTLAGIPVLVSDGLAGDSPDTVALIDASGLCVADGGLTIDASEQATIQMDDAPSGAAQHVSMFQTNSIAIRVERTFGAQAARADSVVLLEGCTW